MHSYSNAYIKRPGLACLVSAGLAQLDYASPGEHHELGVQEVAALVIRHERARRAALHRRGQVGDVEDQLGKGGPVG